MVSRTDLSRLLIVLQEDKIARLEKIKIPAYVVASYTSTIHTYGTFEGFRRIQGEKWLRVHNTDECMNDAIQTLEAVD